MADLKPGAPGIVLVARVDRGDAPVPARVVQCSDCGADCWLSRQTGDSTIALARLSGGGQEPQILCLPCVESAMEQFCAGCRRERCGICGGCDCPATWCVHG